MFKANIFTCELRLRSGLAEILLRALMLLLSLSIGAKAQTKQPANQIIERGKFVFYELNQVKGEENYAISPEGDSILLKSKVELPGKKPLEATLRMRPNLAPERFEIKGTRLSSIDVDTAVEISGRTATVIDQKQSRSANVPDRFFTISGYAPLAVEMMLLRYWQSQNVKGPLKILPAGEVTIEMRGRDTVAVGNKQVPLNRYTIEGITWGREFAWMDSEGRLVALTGIGNDTDEGNIEAVREGYDHLLSFFIKRTAEDGVEMATRLRDRLSPKQEGPIVVLGATLIDGTGKAPVADSAVVISDSRVVEAGPRAQVKIPATAKVIAANGKYVLPGLWDMHAHIMQTEMAAVYIAAGITTARDVGSNIESATTMRDAFKDGRGLGPRMLLAGYINGKNDTHTFDVQVETEGEARAAVRRYKQAGYEQIKIRQDVKLNTLKIICDEAHRLGMTVTGHVPDSMNAIQAVEAGMDQINHIHFLLSVMAPKNAKSLSDVMPIKPESPEAKRVIELFKRKGTVIDPTLAAYELDMHPAGKPISVFEPGYAKLPPEMTIQLSLKGPSADEAAEAQLFFKILLSMVDTLHKAGVPIVAGTDVAVPGHSLYRELELYVEAGLTPMEAIQSATIAAARAMKMDKESGSIEAGKVADLIIVDGDPLRSISSLRKTRMVIARGRLFDCAELWKSLGIRP